ncbi:hypothetical protein [Desulfobacula toluolica]|uniref:Uncharacterized protein n=1 Tax=Desulfobacula toluolica (strain DSM 7467 / Tol2) TaxID=651182 RepID=K0NMG2_DESTT|nr:hypothetical protein [Desulfobacula toluolica]CCK81223.1 uncharacterized protein TOL2_C30640 [Desulfobacula toluolica Tol2]
MYGHHVVEDLACLRKNNILENNHFNEGIGLIIDSIKQAKHFHLGKFQDFITPMDKIFHEKSRVFYGECGEHVRLPYDLCWFEFENFAPDVAMEEDVPKRGVLVKDLGGSTMMAWIVNWPRFYGKWIASPQQYLISVGKTIGQNEQLRKLLTPYIERNGGSPEVIQSYYASNIFPIPMGRKFMRMSQGLMQDDHRDLVALNAALMLLNCKNVVTEDNHPPAKLNKKRKKKGKQELFVYKTLKLVLPSKSENKSGTGDSGIKMKIHLCRGHFKNYTKDSPLFGKYTGLYWWQPHVRGNKSEGMVVKDYKIEAV